MKEAIIFLIGWMASGFVFDLFSKGEREAGRYSNELITQCEQKHNVNKCYLVATPEKPNE